MVDIAGFCQAYDGVDEDVGLTGAGSTDRQLAVSAVHGVACLEGNNTGPAEFIEMGAQLRGSKAQRDVVVVHETIDGGELAADVVCTGNIHEIIDSGVVGVSAKDVLGFQLSKTASVLCPLNEKRGTATNLSG